MTLLTTQLSSTSCYYLPQMYKYLAPYPFSNKLSHVTTIKRTRFAHINRLYQFRDPTSLLFNGYRGYSPVMRPQRCADHSNPSSGVVKNSGTIPLLPPYVMASKRTTVPFHLYLKTTVQERWPLQLRNSSTICPSHQNTGCLYSVCSYEGQTDSYRL